jgi:hypothetical protein
MSRACGTDGGAGRGGAGAPGGGAPAKKPGEVLPITLSPCELPTTPPDAPKEGQTEGLAETKMATRHSDSAGAAGAAGAAGGSEAESPAKRRRLGDGPEPTAVESAAAPAGQDLRLPPAPPATGDCLDKTTARFAPTSPVLAPAVGASCGAAGPVAGAPAPIPRKSLL